MAITGTQQEVDDLIAAVEAAVDATVPEQYDGQPLYDAQTISRINDARDAAVAEITSGITVA